ncbi:MAG: PspC domain-containing protein [Acidimicrobiia bacterium]|nr:PspC domain-containing protein [Acidimicrobiia bacterium]
MISDVSPTVADPAAATPPLLRRSTTDRVVGGVAGGLGRYLGVDPVILRIAFVLLAISGGSGVLLYIIGWIAIPEEKPGDILGPGTGAGRMNGRIVIGSVIIVVGSILLLSQWLPSVDQYLWPLAIIAVGLVVMFGGRR